MAKKKDYNSIEKDDEAFKKFQYNFVMQALRRATYRWPYRNIIMQQGRVDRGFYSCMSCKETYPLNEIERDHIEPVIPITGFKSWDETIKRMFAPTNGWQRLCLICHNAKTLVENEMRKRNGLKPLRIKKKKT